LGKCGKKLTGIGQICYLDGFISQPYSIIYSPILLANKISQLRGHTEDLFREKLIDILSVYEACEDYLLILKEEAQPVVANPDPKG
jgi:hypothetical protein